MQEEVLLPRVLTSGVLPLATSALDRGQAPKDARHLLKLTKTGREKQNKEVWEVIRELLPHKQALLLNVVVPALFEIFL